MRYLWYESRGLIPWLFLILIILIIAILFKEGWISEKILMDHKDAFDVVSKVITMIVVIVGGFLSYIKFFKGRILKPKLNILPTAGVINLNEDNLHWLDIEIQNKGTVAIWNYEIKVYATLHATEKRNIKISEFIKEPDSLKKLEHLIDVGESSHEHAIIRVSKVVWAVTYQIFVSTPNGSTWDRYLTMANIKTETNGAINI